MPAKINKSLLLLLLFLSVLAVGLSYFQIKGAIYSPFIQKVTKQSEVLDQAEIIAILSEQDTDKDGLSDFDEEFVYQTSVYLNDSDGDTFSDKEEIDAQSNPLDKNSTPYHLITEKNVLEEEISITPSSEDISVEEIKNLLINQAGLSQEIVDKLDDKTLENLYNETKQETGIDLKQLQAPDDLMRQFSDLDPSQIRQLLIEQGVDSEMLSSVDDQTLMSMFLQSLLQDKYQK
ncbi:MAG: thrombospondin type 3 repeat-containing protein [Nanoarchaeota archaeon]|nr:thrombospondin type 3 repeat-containing protein [Nanoarchaeota archaeon]